MKPARNQSIECCKLIFSFLIVLTHAPLPGELGGILSTLSRYAVPFFFMVSGYFNYGADEQTVLRRLKHSGQLLLSAILIYTLLGSIATEISNGSFVSFLRGQFPDLTVLAKWIILQANPIAGHLWYLDALVICYLFLLTYTRFWSGKPVNYRPMYLIGFPLFIFLFVVDVISPFTGDYTYYDIIHTAWFFGIPMFILGIFLHQYQNRLFHGLRLTSRVLTITVVFSILLTLLQRKAIGTGIIPFGVLFGAPTLLLLLVKYPTVPFLPERVIAKFGPLSTWVYILHYIIIIYYDIFFQEPVAAILGSHSTYGRPLFALLVSLLSAFLLEQITWRVNRLLRKTS